MREVLTVMVRREGGVLDDSADEHLRDLYDHSITVYEEIEMSRELLAAALEGHMSVISNRLNSVVLRVSAWAAIIAVPTVIASIYGMNFSHMPELHWRLGYPFALALMGVRRRRSTSSSSASAGCSRASRPPPPYSSMYGRVSVCPGWSSAPSSPLASRIVVDDRPQVDRGRRTLGGDLPQRVAARTW